MILRKSKTEKKSKSGTKRRGGFFYSVPGSIYYKKQNIPALLKKEDVELQNCEPSQEWLSILKLQETDKDKWESDVARLNRVIREGGFVNYINKLEK